MSGWWLLPTFIAGFCAGQAILAEIVTRKLRLIREQSERVAEQIAAIELALRSSSPSGE